MFEYLMPSLVMRAPAGSLLEQTSRLIVRRQIDYGASLGLPWGVSESAYNARDLEFTYQYSNFGVPGLGLKRGLGENAVVAPYATALATMVDPTAAARNFATLAGVGARGRYGFYEALDYTPSRVPEDASVAIVRAFMAHHQGMTIVAIADALLDGVDARRGSMPSRWSRRPSCCCRSARRATSPWCAPGPRTRSRPPRCGRSDRRAAGGSPPRTARRSPPICCRTAATR